MLEFVLTLPHIWSRQMLEHTHLDMLVRILVDSEDNFNIKMKELNNHICSFIDISNKSGIW